MILEGSWGSGARGFDSLGQPVAADWMPLKEEYGDPGSRIQGYEYWRPESLGAGGLEAEMLRLDCWIGVIARCNVLDWSDC